MFIFDTTLDAFYAILPIWLMLMGCREQSLILPHDPMTFCSNLVPLFHAHFVLSALEEARRVAKTERARLAAAPAPADVPEADAPPEKKKCSCFRNVVFWGLTANVFIMSIFCLASTHASFVYGLFNSHMGLLIYGCIIFAIPVALFAWLVNFVSPGATQADGIALRTKLGWRGRILFYAVAVAAFPLALNDMQRGTYGSSCPPCDCDSNVLESCHIFEDIESIVWNVDSWNGAIKADVLKLSAKGIKRIEVGAFGDSRFASNAKLVRKLDISQNEIKSLEPGVFDGLESLRAVNIYGNPVQCVEIDPAALRRADGAQITCEA